MRLVLTGDLHLGITNVSEMEAAADKVAMAEPDALAFLGDIGEVIQSPSNFRRCLDIYRKRFDGPILVVIGNHDLYVPPEFAHNSADLWSYMLRDMTKSVGGTYYLEEETFWYDGVAVVGSYMHYDYSARDKVGPCSILPEEWYQVHKKDIIVDGTYHIGLPPDKEFAREIGIGFRARLQAAQDDDTVQKIVILSHVPCMECLVARRPQNFSWSKGTPFFGNLSHEDFIRSCSKVRYVVSAHTHVEQEGEVQGVGGVIKCRTIGSDYSHPAQICIEL